MQGQTLMLTAPPRLFSAHAPLGIYLTDTTRALPVCYCTGQHPMAEALPGPPPQGSDVGEGSLVLASIHIDSTLTNLITFFFFFFLLSPAAVAFFFFFVPGWLAPLRSIQSALHHLDSVRHHNHANAVGKARHRPSRPPNPRTSSELTSLLTRSSSSEAPDPDPFLPPSCHFLQHDHRHFQAPLSSIFDVWTLQCLFSGPGKFQHSHEPREVDRAQHPHRRIRQPQTSPMSERSLFSRAGSPSSSPSSPRQCNICFSRQAPSNDSLTPNCCPPPLPQTGPPNLQSPVQTPDSQTPDQRRTLDHCKVQTWT